jgi:hypothetical protein
MSTRKTPSTQEFSVALLMDNIAEAKKISDVFRQMGIYAHFYNDLDEYWVSSNTTTPDLSIIDVKKMSQGTLLFKNHPKVVNGSLAYAFFYKDSTKPLLSSTYGLDHYGYVRPEVDIMGQVQTILKSRNRELRFEEENRALAARVDRLQKRSTRILNDVQTSYNFENKFQQLQELMTRFGTLTSQDSFNNRVIHLMSEWEDCVQFGIYELNQTRQKLVSPKVVKKGYKQLPDLWLSQVCNEGVARFAREMAEEVAYDIFDKNLRTLKVDGIFGNPDILIIAAFREENLMDFQWEVLENFFTAQYRKRLLTLTKEPAKSSKRLNVWECFTYLDDISFHQSKSRHKLIGLNFNPLIEVIKEKHSNRFYWKSFYTDFITQLEKTLSGNYKVAEYGVQDFMVFIDQQHLEQDFRKLKNFVGEFPYWRYFEDTSLIMTTDMSPEVKVIAPSSVNVIRNVHREIMASSQVEAMPRRMREKESPIRNM